MSDLNMRGDDCDKHTPGPKEKYSDDELVEAATAYLESCRKPKDGKIKVPYVEELADQLDIVRDTLYEREKNCVALSDTLKRLKNLQRFCLMQRTLGRFNPTGAIFQLKVNHDMIEKNQTDITSGGEKIQIPQIIIDKS